MLMFMLRSHRPEVYGQKSDAKDPGGFVYQDFIRRFWEE
jgi:hypothetical protein